MKAIQRGVVAPLGFKCAGVSCGIKSEPEARDLGLILSESPAAAAAVFTTNRIVSHAVTVSREHLCAPRSRGIVVNAGNANACTGPRGLADARRMAALAAQCVGVRANEFLVASTGIIGQRLPMRKVGVGIRDAAAALGRSSRHNAAFARAIMTTDTVPKFAAVEFALGNRKVRIGGAAKGSGMVAPNMATMLAFLTTDCAVARPMLRKALRDTADKTFNCVTVDGDCSTNDTAAILANAAAGNSPIRSAGRAYDAFRRALRAVCENLAESLARDGEGATRLVEVRVTGARRAKDADRVARTIANSPLVKTAVHGGDPNWGRILCAAGHSGAPVEAERMRLRINGVQLFCRGRPCAVRADRLAACMRPTEIRIVLDLGQGRQAARIWTCDLSRDYITINAEYHT